ncbi:MDR family MFS transporter [Arthrobacter tumbae]|uniref:DHA2 family efflux MFS transporter permease subunit n=1 Tax=Arthrobacter tumbae TaxID=163874 RepID=UPI001959F276|nr:DHA2 family efflux MFS transporter permease subunit [Arthrobacter tumbae]MBM7782268.1 DHA2 family lincomycin resistance protein-like MFS transporter [Arthrobacter tumbae]
MPPSPVREDQSVHLATAVEPQAPTRVAPIIAVLALSAFVMILNETVVGVALPNLMQEYSVTATTVQWLTTGFLLTMAVVIPTTGFMLQRFTTRTLFTTALLLFIAGTLLAALAPTFGIILIARVIQAGGTAIILPLLMTTTLTSVAPAHRGTVMGLNSVVISVAPAIGPALSGVVVSALGWRWIFGLMLPVIAVVFVLGLVLLRKGGETRKAPLDALSVVLSAMGFGGLVYALASIDAVLDGAWLPVAALVLGVLALAAFVRRQLRLQRTSDSALLDLRPFAVHNFRVSVAILMVVFAAMIGTVTVLPIYLQTGLGASVLTTGLLLLPGGLIQGIVSPIIGRLYDAVGPRPLVIPGALLVAGGQWWLSTLNAETPLPLVGGMYVMFSVGLAMLMTPLMTAALSALPRNLYGHGSASLNTLQQLAGAAGTAILVAALTVGAATASAGGAAEGAAQASGAQAAFVVGGVLALVGVVMSPFVRRVKDNGARG